MTEFCTYCNDVHTMLDFGKDFAGNDVKVCSDRLSDALVQTMPKDHSVIEDEIIVPKGEGD